MKTSIKTLLVTASLISFSSFAAPVWQDVYAQGNTEFFVEASQGVNVNFTCPDGVEDGSADRNIILTLSNGAMYDTKHNGIVVAAKVGGEIVSFGDPGSMAGISNWTVFWEKISKTKSTSFVITVGEGKDALNLVVPTKGIKAVYNSQNAKGCIRF